MDEKTATALLQRYLEGKAGHDEILLVEQLYRQLHDTAEWHWNEAEKEQLGALIESRVSQRIREEEQHASTGKRQKESGKIRYMKPAWWWAAAIVILLAGAGSYFLFFQKATPPLAATQQQRFRNDVAPGRNAAVLTLAGGKNIALDSAVGAIGRQGSATIMNNNGQLTYNALREKPAGIFYNTLATQRGNQYRLVLPDGSRVWLNAASSITYPTVFSGTERKVTITGEAYFEVAKNDRMPFVVQEGSATVQVLGTHFNMNGYTDGPGLATTLLEGAVRVSSNGSSTVLSPGQQAAARNAGSSLQVLNDVDIEEVMAWKNGQFLFKDATISSIMQEVARWYDVDVVYDTRIDKHFIADIPRNVPLSQLLKLLELTDQVHFRIEGRRINVIQ